MQSIYKISEEFENLFLEIEQNDGELSPELLERLEISTAQMQGKGIAYAKKIMFYDAYAETAKKEIERITAQKKQAEKISAFLKKTISDAMIRFGIDKIESDFVKLSFRKSSPLEIDNEDLVPAEFKKEKIEISVDKTAITNFIKSGGVVDGCRLVEKQNLQIK
jgi:hypothetical protein